MIDKDIDRQIDNRQIDRGFWLSLLRHKFWAFLFSNTQLKYKAIKK